MRDTSDLKKWYSEDIANLLRGVCIASAGLSADEQRGFNIAIVAIAAAVGIEVNDGSAHDYQSALYRAGREAR